MFLTLENAELVEDVYLWRFPKMKYTACVKSITIPDTYFSMNVWIKENSFLEKVLDTTNPFEPLPVELEGDVFRARFIKFGPEQGPIVPSEVTIELTEL